MQSLSTSGTRSANTLVYHSETCIYTPRKTRRAGLSGEYDPLKMASCYRFCHTPMNGKEREEIVARVAEEMQREREYVMNEFASSFAT